MQLVRPTSWPDALAAKAAHPEALPVLGGTDVLVELNFGRERPASILDLSAIDELCEWELDGDCVRIGAGVTYARIVRELGDRLPALATAARTVGSPQVRNRGTVAGNLGSASPAGDAHPPLLALDAEIEVEAASGARRVPARAFFAGPKRNVLEREELIAAVRVPVARGPQQFAKVGRRNAMVIAVCAFAVALDRVARTVGTGIGSAGPTPLRALEAERFLADALDEHDLWDAPGALTAPAIERFGELVASAARPIDDVRATAAYRRRALAVLAQRTARWMLAERAEPAEG